MSLWREFMAAMRGSLALARGESGALALFNVTADGFWHSFLALFPVLPVFLYLQYTDALLSGSDAAIWRELLIFLAQWLSWPLIALGLARSLGLARDYARYIIVYNWSSLPVSLLFLPGAMVIRFGIGDAGLAVGLNLAALALALGFGYLIARRGLGAGSGAAVLFVLADFLFGQLLAALSA